MDKEPTSETLARKFDPQGPSIETCIVQVYHLFKEEGNILGEANPFREKLTFYGDGWVGEILVF